MHRRRHCTLFTSLVLPLFSSALAVPTLPRFPIPVSVDICPHPQGCIRDMRYGDLGLGSPGSHAMPTVTWSTQVIPF